MSLLHDDLGRRLTLERTPTRIVSLVPSLTEALAVSVPDRLVGATDYCTHTGDVDPARVRGTKNPDHGAIARVHPDLVVANREENRKVDVDRLEAAGIPVWVTEIETVAEAFGSLRRLFREGLEVTVPPGSPTPRPSGRVHPCIPPPGPWSRSGGTPGWPSARRRSPATSSGGSG